MKKRTRYSKIKSMSQLKAERLKVDGEINMKEMQMKIEYSGLKESLSITRFLTLLVTRISLIVPFIKTAKNVYEFIVRQFQTIKETNDKSSEPPEDEIGSNIDSDPMENDSHHVENKNE